MNKENLTVKDVAEYLNRSETTIYNMLNNGELPGIKLGGKWIVRKKDLDEFLNNMLAQQQN
ncbi:AlpA family transcriptional regulator [Orenia metallireducens]|jgi:excisionase family DNA binding protein|uniref:Transcriptional regulator, AlpA family n=2 Tax=Orenia metallireducens TaxID=1413210 RepID=A0A285II14_9FIRM|nr:helix-turn-helix domain-containing protein [Orenia metallireducens]OCL24956.1 DNA-binding protein [Orenia metallireducens]PRX17485.1 AlpA family transcriptional regulator [Orenia metallireducens]SNY47437.1 transcriptional regulator, AlpA family [Orenia metallireducens]